MIRKSLVAIAAAITLIPAAALADDVPTPGVSGVAGCPNGGMGTGIGDHAICPPTTPTPIPSPPPTSVSSAPAPRHPVHHRHRRHVRPVGWGARGHAFHGERVALYVFWRAE